MGSATVNYTTCEICGRPSSRTSHPGVTIAGGVTVGHVGIAAVCVDCAREARLERVADRYLGTHPCVAFYLTGPRGRCLVGRVFPDAGPDAPEGARLRYIEDLATLLARPSG